MRRYSDNWVPDWLHLLTCSFCRRARANETSRRPCVPAPLARASAVIPDQELTIALAAIWDGREWRRLEVCTRWSPIPSGYCVTAAGQQVITRNALARADCPAAIRQLRELLELSGWSRLELVGHPHYPYVSGWCERPDKTGIRVRIERRR